MLTVKKKKKKRVNTIFWVTIKKVNEKKLKKLNAILERYMARAHALPHEVSAFIYIYIY